MQELIQAVSAEIEVKKSRFIAQLWPVQSRAEAQQILKRTRAEHPAAVHVCSALICQGDSGLDDDGEPSGTAAKPMYNVLSHKDLGNVLAVVVRYWGGTKLGAGGLTRAYGQAVSEACKLAQTRTPIPLFTRHMMCEFSEEAQLRHCCERFDVSVERVDYTEHVHFLVQASYENLLSLQNVIQDHFKGRVELLEVDNQKHTN